MSVIFTPRARSSRWKALWPLALLLAVSIIGGIWLWRAWPQVLMQSAVWQRSLNLELSRLLQAVAENPAAAGLSLLGFSFVYGVVHALGPGHGKIVITTWLATHPSKLKSSINLTLAASLLQGLVAIALVGALGLLLCWRALKKLRLLLSRPTFTAFTPHHVHHEHCGCGHQHLPAPDQLQSGDDWRARAAIVLSMGMRPCSGAIMVLLFSKVIGVFSWGMAAALAMAAGTSLTITALALLVHSFRQLAVKLGQHQAPPLWRQVGWLTLALAGGVILLAAAGVMWFTAVPAGGGIRPF
ncbi:high-affinity nickel-transporter [Klebsiella variicola At-22]|uniref:nickel/cobalt transporter n=1 Tax=Klebsiella variicola TaxID=244366 RepID=UPI0001BDC9B6|nr:nickel/cobalt transporter [Klebsiella variicola]ADC57120.1 high-affinity nickel-transporter [Klebsiella variicola At-22]